MKRELKNPQKKLVTNNEGDKYYECNLPYKCKCGRKCRIILTPEKSFEADLKACREETMLCSDCDDCDDEDHPTPKTPKSQ